MPWKVTIQFKDRDLEKTFPTSHEAFNAERAAWVFSAIWEIPVTRSHVEEVHE